MAYLYKMFLLKCMVDRLEQPNGTKGTTEERPLFFIPIMLANDSKRISWFWR
jgi:hypothetical protein